MTSKRSKRLDVLALVFISKSFSRILEIFESFFSKMRYVSNGCAWDGVEHTDLPVPPKWRETGLECITVMAADGGLHVICCPS